MLYSTSPRVLLAFSFFSLLILPPPSSTLFPYTTLFRSHGVIVDRLATAYGADDTAGDRLPLEGRPLLAMEHLQKWTDRKSTRLNSSHLGISYAVFCLKKKKKNKKRN